MNLAKELIKIAEMDLKSAGILYKNGLYPQAVFLFQQSVEKAAKAFGLFGKITKPEELHKTISHTSIIVYEKMFREMISGHEAIDKKGLKANYDFWLSAILKIKKSKDKLTTLPHREMKVLLLTMKEHIIERKFRHSKEKKENESEKENKILSKKYETFKKSVMTDPEVYNIIKELTISIKRKYEQMNKKSGYSIPKTEEIEKSIEDYIINIKRVVYPLLYLCIVTLPHAIITRYPQSNKSPRRIYTPQLPLIKMFPKFQKVQKIVLKALKHIM